MLPCMRKEISSPYSVENFLWEKYIGSRNKFLLLANVIFSHQEKRFLPVLYLPAMRALKPAFTLAWLMLETSLRNSNLLVGFSFLIWKSYHVGSFAKPSLRLIQIFARLIMTLKDKRRKKKLLRSRCPPVCLLLSAEKSSLYRTRWNKSPPPIDRTFWIFICQ